MIPLGCELSPIPLSVTSPLVVMADDKDILDVLVAVTLCAEIAGNVKA